MIQNALFKKKNRTIFDIDDIAVKQGCSMNKDQCNARYWNKQQLLIQH